jgi:hypothetical protein
MLLWCSMLLLLLLLLLFNDLLLPLWYSFPCSGQPHAAAAVSMTCYCNLLPSCCCRTLPCSKLTACTSTALHALRTRKHCSCTPGKQTRHRCLNQQSNYHSALTCTQVEFLVRHAARRGLILLQWLSCPHCLQRLAPATSTQNGRLRISGLLLQCVS